MLKSDKQLLQALVSTDEDIRLRAASALDALPLGHFEDHPISRAFVAERLVEFKTAYAATKSERVREWIAESLADVGIVDAEIGQIVANCLNDQCSFLPTILYLIWNNPGTFQNLKAAVSALVGHPDHEVRWRVALVLETMKLSYEEDADTLRALTSDVYPTTRTYAVLGMRKLGTLRLPDIEALHRVVEMDEGAAAKYAAQMLNDLPEHQSHLTRR